MFLFQIKGKQNQHRPINIRFITLVTKDVMFLLYEKQIRNKFILSVDVITIMVHINQPLKQGKGEHSRISLLDNVEEPRLSSFISGRFNATRNTSISTSNRKQPCFGRSCF